MGVRPVLSAVRAAKAPVGCFPLLSALVHVANEHPAARAGVGPQAIEAGVVRLYCVVVILGGWICAGCARLLCGHWDIPPLAWRSRIALVGSGASSLSATLFYHLITIYLQYTVILW